MQKKFFFFFSIHGRSIKKENVEMRIVVKTTKVNFAQFDTLKSMQKTLLWNL